MTLREPLEIPFSTPRALRSRPPLSSLLPAADALMLLGVSATLGFKLVSIAYGVVTFLILNGDTSRKFRINPRLGDEAGWLLGRVSMALLVLLSVGSVARLAHISLLGSQLGQVTKVELARGLAEALMEHADYGLHPIGFLGRPTGGTLPLPCLGDNRDFQRVIHEHEVRRVLVAFGEMHDQELVTILRANERVPAEIHVVPRFFELSGVPQGAAVDDVDGIPLFHLRRPALRPAARFQKRAFDMVAASLLLFLTLPLLAVLALAVRLSSPGPILFRQKRVGLNGQLFEIVKFRTMFENDDSDTTWLSDKDHERVTAVGHLLRRTSLDEVPQLLNVLRGEMSLVGPRPERPHYTGQFAETVSRYDDRHRVVGGITGWAQINGRSRGLDSVPQRARLDNYYIENWSLWRDLVIIARTIGVLFRGR
jgi:exopolysaccharide biosynthesis polyprenyl glycosylphosphotransferase